MKNNRPKKLKKRGNLFFNLLKDHIFRLIIGFLILSLTTVLSLVIYYSTLFIPEIRMLFQRYSLLEENFSKVKVEAIAGKDGTIEILDENNDVVFPTNSKTSYSEEYLKTIPSIYQPSALINTKEYNNKILITCSHLYADYKWYLLIDNDYNYIDSSDFFYIKNKYTKEDIDYIFNDFESKTFLYFYDFVANSGNKYKMIIRNKVPYESFNKDIISLARNIGIALLAIYLIFVVISLMKMTNKIRKPIKAMENAMQLYTDGKQINLVHFSGVSELVNIANTFNTMVTKLQISEEKNRKLADEKKRLLADISHDLKTPITIIQGYIKALSDGKISDQDKAKYYSIVYNKSESLNKQINILSDYNKLEHPDFKLSLKYVNLCDLIRDYIATNYEYLDNSGFILEVNIPDDNYSLRIDEAQFTRCLENLISNCVRYNPAGTKIKINLYKNETSFVLEIADDGIGIDDNFATSIFNPFVIGSSSRTAHEGTGLGLTIVKKIINLHGGDIILKRNQNGYSTIFQITLQ